MIRRATRSLGTVLAVLFIVTVLAGVLPVGPALFRVLVVVDPPRNADAIVVLGGGVHNADMPSTGTTARLVHGLRLHHRGYAPAVILTGGNPVAPDIPESVVMARVATELGTRPELLIVEKVADRTATQAQAVARLARERNIRTILLVTSGEHSWRSVRLFRKTGLTVISTPVVANPRPPLRVAVHPLRIADRIAGLLPITYEAGAIALYWWRGWL